MLSVKIEDKHALAHAEKVAAVPCIAFAEWGPGDMGLSLGFPEHHDPRNSACIEAALAQFGGDACLQT